MNPTFRPEHLDDYLKITEINNSAFGRDNEGKLVERLRKTPRFVPDLSLVAECENEIAGHILFYPVTIASTGRKRVTPALAPVAVLPAYQGKGIGSRLVEEGLEAAKDIGCKSVIVLGYKEYYLRFGFQPASKWHRKAPFDVPDDVFMALELERDALKNVRGTVEYPEDFNDV